MASTNFGHEFLAGAPVQEAYTRAREAADRALALSPDLAAAHNARGYVLQVVELDWRGAEAEFRRAALAPNDSDSKFSLGTQLAAFGEVEAAIELTHQALATEPLRLDYYYNLAVYYSGINRLDEAERSIDRCIELAPTAPVSHWELAVIEIQRGNAQAALDAAQQEVPDKPMGTVAVDQPARYSDSACRGGFSSSYVGC